MLEHADLIDIKEALMHVIVILMKLMNQLINMYYELGLIVGKDASAVEKF